MTNVKLIIDQNIINQYSKHYFWNHPKAKKVPIEKPYHPTINQWMVLQRPAMNALKQRWKDFIKWFIMTQGYANLRIKKCEMKFITYYMTNRRHDVDNSCPKFILDGMCESGFIEDDDFKHVTSLTLECRIDENRPRTEIEVTIYE